MCIYYRFWMLGALFLSIVDTSIEFHFNLVDEVDHLIVADYHKPLTFCDIPNQSVAEQLTYRDAVSRNLFNGLIDYIPNYWMDHLYIHRYLLLMSWLLYNIPIWPFIFFALYQMRSLYACLITLINSNLGIKKTFVPVFNFGNKIWVRVSLRMN